MKYWNQFLFLAKTKLRAHREHETGGGPPPPAYNDLDLTVLRILGETPSFVGVIERETDSGIEMPMKKKKNDLEVRRCNANVVAESTGLTLAINSGNLGKLFSFTYVLPKT